MFLFLSIIMVLTSTILLMEGHAFSLSSSIEEPIQPRTSSITELVPQPLSAKSSLYINSQEALLIQLDDQDVLLDINSSQKIYPASMTKIMTAIIAVENLPDLEEPVFLGDEVFSYIYTAGASMAGFQPNEKVRGIDLLYGVLLPSGAECSIGLAMQISGSEDNFVKLMNQKAKALGMEDTHFANVTGLHDDNHYSTVRDIAALLEYALQNDTFRQIFTSHQYSTAATNMHPDGITFYSSMFRMMDEAEFDGGIILGGKTGYTSKAGQCLASLAEKDGTEYILVTAGAAGTPQTEQLHIKDAHEIYENYLPN